MNKQKVGDELERLHQKYNGCKTDIEIGCMQIISFMNHEIKRGAFNDDSLQQENERLKEEVRRMERLHSAIDRDIVNCEMNLSIMTQQNKAYASALKDIKYQVEQSDHPAGLGVLTAIKMLGETM